MNQRARWFAKNASAGYGVVSFGAKDLEWVKGYVWNQRERHANGQVEVRLERITALEDEAEAEPREAT